MGALEGMSDDVSKGKGCALRVCVLEFVLALVLEFVLESVLRGCVCVGMVPARMPRASATDPTVVTLKYISRSLLESGCCCWC